MSGSLLESMIQYRGPTYWARVLGIHPNTIIRWCRDGIIFSDGTRRRPEYVRTPNGYRLTESQVNAFLELVKADRERPLQAAPAEPAPKKRRVKAMRDGLNKAGF
jgi:hypothetical protein